MLFNSVEFLAFFLVVCCLYFALPYRYRWVLLLVASYYFYASWRARYLLLIFASTLVDYCAGLIMGRAEHKSTRTLCLLGSLTCNLGLLFTFKYFNFFNDSLRELFEYLGMPYRVGNLGALLPVGISFYTFQTLSYTIEVYRGTHGPQRHLGIFALYVAFFPQLVAGPIERSNRFLPQLFKKINFDYDRVVAGLRLMLWGLFKKVVVADRLALFVDKVYDSPGLFSGPVLLLATVFFAFQIYCDFSGYSDIAVGAARVMGYRLMTNFDRPYLARSVGEFWRRWHISLSTWFRDYVYIPLGGGRVPVRRLYVNLFIVFTVSGLWHGANWKFIVWGALHAFYYIFSHLTAPLREKATAAVGLHKWPMLRGWMQMLTTFALVCVGWVFFRAATVAHALDVFLGLFRGWGAVIAPGGLTRLLEGTNTSAGYFCITLAALAVLHLFERSQEKGESPRLLSLKFTPLRWAVYVSLILALFNLGVTDEIPFLYFQF